MHKRIPTAVLLAGLSAAAAWAAPGDYEPPYDQSGGYGTATLDERVAKLEKKLSGNSQMEMLNRLEQLQADVLRLRGEVEDLTHELETVKKQQRDMYQDLDRRLQATAAPALPAQSAATGEPPPPDAQAPEPPLAAPSPAPVPVAPPATAAPVPATPTPAASPAPSPTPAVPPATRPLAAEPAKPPVPIAPARPATPPSADSAARQAAYQKGFNLLKEGKYSEAIKEFKGFLGTYPKGEYSDNAQYWLAEAHYVNRELPSAREAFRKFAKDYPQSPKVSDAQLKLGYIDCDTGQWASAREALSDVIKRYPDTSAAKLAQKRLDKLKQEGH